MSVQNCYSIPYSSYCPAGNNQGLTVRRQQMKLNKHPNKPNIPHFIDSLDQFLGTSTTYVKGHNNVQYHNPDSSA
jgi:hypothetical protein